MTLGDAYTAGTDTGAPKRDSWPAQLVQAMERGDVRLRLVDNLADSGQTSQNVLDEQLPQVESLHPDVVTVQVGVNDIVAREFEAYRANVTRILDELLAHPVARTDLRDHHAGPHAHRAWWRLGPAGGWPCGGQ